MNSTPEKWLYLRQKEETTKKSTVCHKEVQEEELGILMASQECLNLSRQGGRSLRKCLKNEALGRIGQTGNNSGSLIYNKRNLQRDNPKLSWKPARIKLKIPIQ